MVKRIIVNSLTAALLSVSSTLMAQWTVSSEQETTGSTAPNTTVDQQLEAFESEKCSNGGTTTRAFIDFSTEDPVEAAYVAEVAQRFSQTVQEQQLGVSFTDNSARSVRFMFELDRLGAVKTLNIFAKEEEQGLRDFVAAVVTRSAPYPSFENTVHTCFTTLVVSATFDF